MCNSNSSLQTSKSWVHFCCHVLWWYWTYFLLEHVLSVQIELFEGFFFSGLTVFMSWGKKIRRCVYPYLWLWVTCYHNVFQNCATIFQKAKQRSKCFGGLCISYDSQGGKDPCDDSLFCSMYLPWHSLFPSSNPESKDVPQQNGHDLVWLKTEAPNSNIKWKATVACFCDLVDSGRPGYVPIQ